MKTTTSGEFSGKTASALLSFLVDKEFTSLDDSIKKPVFGRAWEQVFQDLSATWPLRPVNRELYYRALCHRSFVHEHPGLAPEDNEKLEFIGDAVVNLLVATQLAEEFPEAKEGQLSKFRAGLVNEESLSVLAVAMGMEDHLLLGRGELKGNVPGAVRRDGPLADAIEALLGACYLDQGLEVAQAFFLWAQKRFEEKRGRPFISHDHLVEFDSKTRLQELCMARWQILPEYRSQASMGDEGPGHHVELWIQGQKRAETWHLSKRKGERALAERVLREWREEEQKTQKH